MLSSREIAGVAWLLLIAALAIGHPRTRSDLPGVARAFLQPQVTGVFLIFAAWVSLEVYAGARVGLWDPSMLGATVLWTLLSGVALLFSFEEAARNNRYVLHKLREVLAITVAVDILVNLRTFHVLLEFVLQGGLALLAMIAAYASVKPEYRGAQRLANGMLGFAGLCLVVGGVAYVVQNPAAVFSLGSARALAMPLWLGLGLLPLVTVVGIYSSLERVFRMMSLENKSRAARLRNLAPLALNLVVRPAELHSFRNHWERQLALADSLAAAQKVVVEYRSHRQRETDAERERQERLERYAGVKGTDEEGRQLDRREFEATHAALRWIHNRHHGWYGHDPVGYKAEKVQGFVDAHEFRGLPAEHGITIRVDDGGGAWYAWRRTVGGWVIALGARDGDYAEWLYDGPEPPRSFPHPSDEWGRSLYERLDSPNW